MPLESFLKYEGVDPHQVSIFIDANSLHQAHPYEVAPLKLHITAGVREEFRQWEDYQFRLSGQSQFAEALSKVDIGEVLQKILSDRVYQNTLRFNLSASVVREIEERGLIVKDKEGVDPLIEYAARLNAKRLAAEAAARYCSVWEATHDRVYRRKQIDAAVGHAVVKYNKRLGKHGLDFRSGYDITRSARIRNINRHVGYLFDAFCADPIKAKERIDENIIENSVDQRLLMTARYFNPHRDKKQGKERIIVSEDIDLIEMIADLSFIAPRLMSNVRIIRPRRR